MSERLPTNFTLVLNDRFGGFELSPEALKRLGWSHHDRFLTLDISTRSDKSLVEVCKVLGPKASADGKPFALVDVPDSDIQYVRLREYDGRESLSIDEHAKALGNKATVLDAIRAVMATPLSDAEKLSVITTLLK